MIRSKLAMALALSTALTSFSVAANADGFEAGSFLVRARALGVIPEDSTNHVQTAGNTPLGNIGGIVGANSTVIPELDLTYFLTPNVGIEAIAGVSRNKVFASGNAVDNKQNPLGTTYILPPTITAQWHFFPSDVVNPYVGAGLNYTMFFDTQNSTWLGGTAFKLKPSIGGAIQFGADVQISGRWYANMDFKKIWLTTKATFVATAVGDNVTSRVALDPWLIGGGIGYRF